MVARRRMASTATRREWGQEVTSPAGTRRRGRDPARCRRAMILIISLEVDVQVDRGVWGDPRSESGEFGVLESPKEISALVIRRQVRIV
jgi:hypothetical protein